MRKEQHERERYDKKHEQKWELQGMCLHACKDLLMLKRWGGGLKNLSNNMTMYTIYLIPLLDYDNEHDQHIEHHKDLVWITQD
jgi:hypothetical protein